jgi:hypothetical protein
MNLFILLVLILPLMTIAFLVVCSMFRRTLDKWPPISEDEFISRCSPGVNRERALKVRRIVSEQLGVDYDRVYPEQRFIEDLGC